MGCHWFVTILFIRAIILLESTWSWLKRLFYDIQCFDLSNLVRFWARVKWLTWFPSEFLNFIRSKIFLGQFKMFFIFVCCVAEKVIILHLVNRVTPIPLLSKVAVLRSLIIINSLGSMTLIEVVGGIDSIVGSELTVSWLNWLIWVNYSEWGFLFNLWDVVWRFVVL